MIHFARRKGSKDKKKRRIREEKGGLTPYGRQYFKRKFGQNLRPGVKKPISKMTPDDMRRKGSWATRFYGSEKLAPLVKPNGQPTRLALSAAAWGEPVPRTVADARKIAAKGRKLLAMYRIKKSARD